MAKAAQRANGQREMIDADLGMTEVWYIDYGTPFVFNGVEWHRLLPAERELDELSGWGL